MHEKQFYGRGPGGFHRIAYTEWGQASAQPPVICVHGLTRNGRDFDCLAHALEGEGRQVFCPDIVGRGKSDWLANAVDYNYAQYLTDMTALIARTGAESVDWVGTSMGGHIGMLLAAEANTPIRRLVINDIGPFIPLVAIRRVHAYVGQSPVFDDLEGVEKHMREIYASFGDLSDANWRHLARYGARTTPNNKLSLAWDPAIAVPFLALNQDVDFFPGSSWTQSVNGVNVLVPGQLLTAPFPNHIVLDTESGEASWETSSREWIPEDGLYDRLVVKFPRQ